ncbi:MAG: hypothetical protein AAFU59_11045 [Pseudomonadota bacterium]
MAEYEFVELLAHTVLREDGLISDMGGLVLHAAAVTVALSVALYASERWPEPLRLRERIRILHIPRSRTPRR